MEKILSQPFVQETLKWITVVMLSGFYFWLKAQFKMIMRKLEMNHLQQKATDFALEKSLGNGYSKYRSSKLDELIKVSRYVNADDFK